jgi:L-fuconolactonase
MLVDAHQHFWRYRRADYDWIDDSMAALRRDFLPEDLAPLLRASGIDACVAVQARQSEAENDFLLDLADRHDFVRGVVGWVDLREPRVGSVLDRLRARKRFRGVRHVAQSEPDDFLHRPDVRRGIAELASRGLTYDLLVYWRQLPAVIDLVRAFPDQPFVLDHLGKPPIAAGALEPWASGIRALAALPNASAKLSGLVTEADWRRWRPSDLAPYLEVALEAFGPARLMLGSDWPVCTLAASHEAAVRVVRDFVARLSVDERDAISGKTATRFYGLDRPA